MVMVIQPVVQTVLSPLAGILADRIDAAKLASLGMGICGAGLWLLREVRTDTPLWSIGAVLCLMGLGFALFASPNMMVIMGSVELKYYSIASFLRLSLCSLASFFIALKSAGRSLILSAGIIVLFSVA